MIESSAVSVRTNLAAVEGVQNDKLDTLKSIPEATRPPLSDLINTWCPVKKIFVAVHGIGDQFQGETVQSVAFRVCDYVGVPAAMPLGRFHGPGGTVTKAFIPDPDRDPPIQCGFAEIYWANVPQFPPPTSTSSRNPRSGHEPWCNGFGFARRRTTPASPPGPRMTMSASNRSSRS